MKVNITISEIYGDDEIENLSPETQEYLKRSTEQSIVLDEIEQVENEESKYSRKEQLVEQENQLGMGYE